MVFSAPDPTRRPSLGRPHATRGVELHCGLICAAKEAAPWARNLTERPSAELTLRTRVDYSASRPMPDGRSSLEADQKCSRPLRADAPIRCPASEAAVKCFTICQLLAAFAKAMLGAPKFVGITCIDSPIVTVTRSSVRSEYLQRACLQDDSSSSSL